MLILGQFDLEKKEKSKCLDIFQKKKSVQIYRECENLAPHLYIFFVVYFFLENIETPVALVLLFAVCFYFEQVETSRRRETILSPTTRLVSESSARFAGMLRRNDTWR